MDVLSARRRTSGIVAALAAALVPAAPAQTATIGSDGLRSPWKILRSACDPIPSQANLASETPRVLPSEKARALTPKPRPRSRTHAHSARCQAPPAIPSASGLLALAPAAAQLGARSRGGPPRQMPGRPPAYQGRDKRAARKQPLPPKDQRARTGQRDTAEPQTPRSTETPPDRTGEGTPGGADAAGVHWIWSPAHTKDQVPPATCYCRGSLELPACESAQMQITCDDAFTLFVNGQQVAAEENWRLLRTYDVKGLLRPGRNIVAVEARNIEPGSAGLVVRLVVEAGGQETVYGTDTTWRTSLKDAEGWQAPDFDDSRWVAAQSFGPFGSTLPWTGQVAAVAASGASRFVVQPEFRVERVISGERTGSLLCMAFNEWGEVLASVEGGGLLLFTDDDEDGAHETVISYCEAVRNCQGILPLNGLVYVTGDGPEGPGLYVLEDADQDRAADSVEHLLSFTGKIGEHGPHAVLLGPDGFLYVVVGNHAQFEGVRDPGSPYQHEMEGDLVQPKYEDAGGHAVGIKAPGGTILRVNTEGRVIQVVAGGLRNAYDAAFSSQGELFTYDSDMEWDVELPWYRPTRILHVVAGAEFGWRSGWSKWPEYYLDSLPAALHVGRGSPTGLEFYNHFMFPVRFHNALFACDWSQGRILAIRIRPQGASFRAQAEVFLEGRPLNATDLAVGPDGWLYFCTGGRGSEGGLYRVVWTGRVPPQPRYKGIMRALRQPQLNSAWSRQYLATLKEQMGQQWDKQLAGAVNNSELAPADRLRALDLMQLLGPFPSPGAIFKLSFDRHPELRARAAWLMGLHGDETSGDRLLALLRDASPLVRRHACEALQRGGYLATPESLLPLLDDQDRHVAWAARLALEQVPPQNWRQLVLSSRSPRVVLRGALALLRCQPDAETAESVLARIQQMLKLPVDSIADDDFVDLLRVTQLALICGGLTGDDLPELREQIAEEYPATEPRINRELVRLVVHLQASSALERMLAELRGTSPQSEKLHLAAHLRFLKTGWSLPQRLELVEFYEHSRHIQGGYSLPLYFDNFCRDFVAEFDAAQREQLIREGTRLPAAALHALALLPEQPGNKLLGELITLDGALAGINSPEAQRLQTGIVAVLARSKEAAAMAYLREAFEKYPDRRPELAMGLAQQPDGENWPLLLRALPLLEGVAAAEVLAQLATVERTAEDAESIRQVILCGLRLGEADAALATRLLRHWTADQPEANAPDATASLAAWQQWYAETYPSAPPAELPRQTPQSNWSYEELLGFLNTPSGQGDAARGALVYEKARCAKCHRFGHRGETGGPELTSVAQRFHKKEILEAVLFPSHVISDQYASQSVVTVDGKTLVGIVAAAGENHVTILQPTGEKVTIERSEIESIEPHRASVMPEGLLNNLTLQEIADLFAYLSGPPAHLSRRPDEADSPGRSVIRPLTR